MKAIFDVIYVEALSIICHYSPLFPLAGVDSQSMSDDDRGHRVIKIKWSNQISFLQRAVQSLQSVHNGSITHSLRREESRTWWQGLMRPGKSKSDRESLRGSFNTNGQEKKCELTSGLLYWHSSLSKYLCNCSNTGSRVHCLLAHSWHLGERWQRAERLPLYKYDITGSPQSRDRAC